jgi:hypothetical protein
VTRHRIRLREPWQREPGRVALWRRRFGRPTGLGPQTEVWLVVENARVRLSVRLNGESLGRISGEAGSGRFEIAGRLLVRNEIAITAELPSMPVEEVQPSPPADVCLEIVADA